MDSAIVGTCRYCEAPISGDYVSAVCPRCGELLSIEILRRLDNPESRRVLQERAILPYEKVVEPPVPEAAAPSGDDPRTAGFLIRAAARGIDLLAGLIVSIPASITAFMLLTLIGTPGGVQEWVQRMQGLSTAAVVLSLVGQTLYSTLCEWIAGATLGKLACGLRVVSRDFGPPTLRGAFIRSAAFLIDGMFVGFVALHSMQHSPLQQRYGDKWGGTVVVKVREVPGSGRGAARVLLGTVLGCGVWVAVLTYSSVSRVIASS